MDLDAFIFLTTVVSMNLTTQVDQNGIVYDPKTDRKCRKNGTYTGIYG